MTKKSKQRRLGRRILRKAEKILSGPLYRFDPFGTLFDDVEDALYYESAHKSSVSRPEDSLLVMTWNIKFGGARIDFWFDAHGDRVVMKKYEVLAGLEGLAQKIRLVDPDILLLQEVDVDSRRVAFVDQMQWLLDHTGLNYGVYASQWRSSFVPVRGLGRVDMGNAILSKFPIIDARRLSLPQMKSQDLITRYFYLKRHILTAKVVLPQREPLHAVTTHAEAFSQEGTKKVQIDLFKAELDRIDAAGGIFVAGGDLNTLPPGSKRQSRFPDVVNEDEFFMASDYRKESDWLHELYETYQPAIALSEYLDDNRPHYTHSTSAKSYWNRKLDYLFTNGHFKEGTAMTHQDERSGGMETMALSDHAPISARIQIGSIGP